MNGWMIGGLVCMIYMVSVGGLALKKSPGLIKIVKAKMGKNMSDKAAILTSYIAAGVVGIGGIVLFIIGAGK